MTWVWGRWDTKNCEKKKSVVHLAAVFPTLCLPDISRSNFLQRSPAIRLRLRTKSRLSIWFSVYVGGCAASQLFCIQRFIRMYKKLRGAAWSCLVCTFIWHQFLTFTTFAIPHIMFLIDTTKKAFDMCFSAVRITSQQFFNVALVIVLLLEGAIEFSEQAASDLSLLMKVIRSNSINWFALVFPP